jgi:hypothetical protein
MFDEQLGEEGSAGDEMIFNEELTSTIKTERNAKNCSNDYVSGLFQKFHGDDELDNEYK